MARLILAPSPTPHAARLRDSPPPIGNRCVVRSGLRAPEERNPTMLLPKGTVALITGAARGLGWGIARAFGLAGARVAYEVRPGIEVRPKEDTAASTGGSPRAASSSGKRSALAAITLTRGSKKFFFK